MNHKTYTQEEISRALNKLNHEMDKLILQRKEVNSQIREKRKNIKYYEQLDVRQYKAF